MSALATLRDRVERELQDESNLSWSTGEVDEAIRLALAEYSMASPLEGETFLTLPGAGREIALDSVTRLKNVTEVWWPYDSSATSETWPPNQVKGFRIYWDDARPVLLISTLSSEQPQTNDELRLWYTKNHAIQDLDSAAATTLPAEGEDLLVMGAAGHAGLIGAVDRGEILNKRELRLWAESRLREFRKQLEGLRASGVRYGDPWTTGWKMDKWDG